MEIAKIKVSGTRLEVLERREIPAGLQGGRITFVYDGRWASLAKTVVFQGLTTKDVVNAGEEVTIPAEVVKKPGVRLWVGIYGVEGDSVAIPTLWLELGVTRTGTDPSGDTTTESTLPVWAQLQANMGDPVNLKTAVKASLVAAVNELVHKTEPENLNAVIAKYLAENLVISGSGVVDPSLTISGAAADAKVTGERLDKLSSDTLLKAYPVDSVYMTGEDTSPVELFGGDWEKVENTALTGVQIWKRLTLGIPVYIVTQPQNVRVAYGQTAAVSVEAIGDGLTYTWYFANADSEGFSVSNQSDSVFTMVMDTAKNGRRVYCLIKDKYGNSVTSDMVVISML